MESTHWLSRLRIGPVLASNAIPRYSAAHSPFNTHSKSRLSSTSEHAAHTPPQSQSEYQSMAGPSSSDDEAPMSTEPLHQRHHQEKISGQQQKMETKSQQHWDPAFYQKECGFVSELGSPVLDLLRPCPGEKVLDLGCGDGTLAARMQEQGCLVLGVDSSPQMVAAALSRNVKAQVLDGHHLALRFPTPEFDAVFSNAALHWMKEDPRKVVSGVNTCLKPGGRFVGEFGGFGNVAAVVTALLGALTSHGLTRGQALAAHPWFYPTAAEYRALLEEERFIVEHIELIHRPTELPGGIQSWLTAFAGPFLSGLPKEDQVAVCKDVEALLKPSLCTSSGIWVADYVRLRFKANKPCA